MEEQYYRRNPPHTTAEIEALHSKPHGLGRHSRLEHLSELAARHALPTEVIKQHNQDVIAGARPTDEADPARVD